MPKQPTIPNFPPQGIQAELDLLYLYNPDVANELVKELQEGLITMKELEQELKAALEKLGNVVSYKGELATKADLPTENQETGDLYHITDVNESIMWDGSNWLSLGDGFTQAQADDLYINSDASTYRLKKLSDAFNYSHAFLAKVFNEDKMPTKDAYTLWSLGWTYNDSNNQPTLLATNLANGLFYYYHGTEDNCTPEAWQEFIFDAPVVQVETMPTADATNVNKIYQYVGGTTAQFKNGYFYKNVEEDGSYVWNNIPVQDIPAQAVTSVNTKTGAVVLTGDDINATVAGTEKTVTAQLTDLNTSIGDVKAVIPAGASETNQLVTKDLFNQAITSANKGATMADVTEAASKVYRAKGSVATYADLPSTDNTEGDVYNVLDTDKNYVWDGTRWDDIGGTVDLSAYSTTAQIDAEYAKKTDLNSLLSKDQGSGNAGKYLRVGQDGLVILDTVDAGDPEGIIITKGDYCTTYGIITLPSPITITDNGTKVVIPAGTVLKTPAGRVTVLSPITHPVSATDDFTMMLVAGEIFECQVYFEEKEPGANGVTTTQAWWNGTIWQFRSVDTGNVWRSTDSVGILADCLFTNGNLTRIETVGYNWSKIDAYTKTETDALLAPIESSISILQTTVNLADTIGGDVTVMLDELTALEIDGRPSHKAPGATVFGPNGTQGIIDSVDADAETAVIKTTVVAASGGGASLPDQTGHSGYLQTNGVVASWSDIQPFTLWKTGSGNGIVLGNTNYTPQQNSVAVGVEAIATRHGIAIGAGVNAAAWNSIAIGHQNQPVSASGTAVIGSFWYAPDKELDINSLYFAWNGSSSTCYKIVGGDGIIPSDRFAATPTEDGTYVLKLTKSGDTTTYSWVKES